MMGGGWADMKHPVMEWVARQVMLTVLPNPGTIRGHPTVRGGQGRFAHVAITIPVVAARGMVVDMVTATVMVMVVADAMITEITMTTTRIKNLPPARKQLPLRMKNTN